jgi:hypothetical protein
MYCSRSGSASKRGRQQSRIHQFMKARQQKCRTYLYVHQSIRGKHQSYVYYLGKAENKVEKPPSMGDRQQSPVESHVHQSLGDGQQSHVYQSMGGRQQSHVHQSMGGRQQSRTGTYLNNSPQEADKNLPIHQSKKSGKDPKRHSL